MTATAKYLRIALGLVVIAGLIMMPLNFNRYGLFILSQWAVMTIAAMGLNLTLGYAGQVSLAQGAFVGIGAYAAAIMTTQGLPLIAALGVAIVLCFAIGWILGYPALRVQHHYLAFVTLAFSTLAFLVFRNEELADQRHLRHQQHSAAERLRFRHQQAAAVLLSLPRLARHRVAGDVVADPLALGPRLHGAARKSDPGAVARRRYPPLHADGVCDRLGAGRRRRHALCAADAIHRSGAVQPVALARSVDDGDRRRRRLLLRSVPRRDDRGAAAGMAALHRRLLSDALRDRGDPAADLFADRHSRASSIAFSPNAAPRRHPRCAPSPSPGWRRRHDRGPRSQRYQEEFWRHHRGRRRQLRRPGGRDPRPDRTERLRQVDAVQLHSRPAHAERRRGQGRRQGRHRPAAVRAQSPRRQPHLPAAAGVSETVGAGEPDPRRAGAPGQHDVAPVRSLRCRSDRRPPTR